MKRHTLALVALLAAGCESIPETITLPNGATAYSIACLTLEDCEQRARQICKRLDYFVHEKTEHVPTESKTDLSMANPGATGLGDVQRGSKMRDDDNRPWWSIVVACSPPPDQVSSKIEIKENIAEFEKSKTAYIEAVCELRDPELRRKEMEIARQDYGDVQCDKLSPHLYSGSTTCKGRW